METEFKVKTKGHTKFSVRAGDFEGPLEMLLELIEKRKLHINSVSLSQVADEFIEHTKSYENFPIADSADFILIASTLLLIKSKSLLPTLDLSEEEKVSIEDLENRLALYKKYKDLGIEISKMFGNFLYFAEENKQIHAVFSPTPEINLQGIKEAMDRALQNAPKPKEDLPKVSVKKIISLEEMINRLSERIEKSLRTSFRVFSGMDGSTGSPQVKEDRINVIVSFLAMLELVKRGLVRASQDIHFEDIKIESENITTPTYQ